MFSKLNEWHADASKKVNEAGDWVRDRITDVSSFHSDAFQFVSMLISDKEDAVDTMHYFACRIRPLRLHLSYTHSELCLLGLSQTSCQNVASFMFQWARA